jgi:long-chain acyl-CoA synthetase
MPGYWQNDAATKETFVDGWLKTGDVGYADEDGYIFLVDRLKDVILCSGYNVYPRAIEEALYLHEQIAEVTVIGVPDQYRGQAPKAFVRLKDDAAGVTAEDLRAFLDDKISRIEMPREIEIREELPKTMVGKLSKKELVEEERLKREGKAQ